MAQGKAPTFACAACGARYPWKPQFAGKKVKCKCGTSVPIPAENPTAPARPAPAARPAVPAPTVGGSAPDDDGMYDFADDPKPAPAVAAPVLPGLPSASIPTAVKSARSAAAAKGAAPAAQPIGYFPGVTAADRAAAAAADDSALAELYLPIGLFAAGLVLAVVQSMYFDRFTLPFTSALALVGIRLVLDMVLICLGGLVVVKYLEVSFGSPGPALLKIAAIALFAPAIGVSISYLIHDPIGLIGWIISLAVTWLLFSKLFDMEAFDVVALTIIIDLVRMWAGYALLGAILSGMGLSLGGMGGIHTPLSEAEANSDRMVRDEIDLGRPIDAKPWLDEFGGHLFGNTPHAPCVQLVDALTAAGCKQVLIEHDQGQATELFAELPSSADKRKAAFQAAADFCKISGDTPPVDKGQSYLVMGFSTFVAPPANYKPRGT